MRSYVDLGGELTEAERRVAALVASGASNKAVAHQLTVSVKTVEFHLSNVYRKLDVGSRHELIQLVTGAAAREPSGTVTFLAARFELSGDAGSRGARRSSDDALAVARSRAEEVVRTCGGRPVAIGSNALIVAFEVASRAVSSAIEIVGTTPHDAVVMSAAVHTGTADWLGHGYIGAALDKADRIATMAGPGQVVVSGSVVGLLDDGFEVVMLGRYNVDGRRHEALYLAAGPVETDLIEAETGTGNLPWSATLIGREREVSELAALLDSRRLTTVTGPGGVGKSSLALVAARAASATWRDGRWFVDLSAVREPRDVAVATAAALRLLGTSSTMRGDGVAALLGSQQRLIVLDNCEHVLDAAAPLAAVLVSTCPNVTVLATSRERLDLPTERVVRLAPIPVDAADGPSAAAQLFAVRARDVADGDFDPDPRETVLIEKICERLDGLPLAIELAAARLPGLSVSDIAEGLDRSLDVLTRRHAIGQERHRSLDAAIRWSYALLDDHERRCLDALAVFPNDFDAAAAAAVATALGVDAPSTQLASLIERSLVQPAPGAPQRYRLLDTIRSFARAELDTQARTVDARRAHLEHYVAVVTTADDDVRHTNEQAGHARFRDEWHNLRAAIQTACDLHRVEQGAQIVERALWWAITRLRIEIGAWAAALDESGDAVEQLTSVPLVAAQLFAAAATNDGATTDALVARASRLDDATRDQAEPWIPCTASFTSGGEQFLHLTAEVQGRAARHGDLFWETVGALQEGAFRADSCAAGTLDVATELPRIQECVAIADRLDNPNGLAYAARVLGSVLTRSEPERARQLLQRSLDLARPLDLELLIPQSLIELSRLENALGDAVGSLGHVREAIALRRRTGAHADLSNDVACAAHALALLGEPELAARCASFWAVNTTWPDDWFHLRPLLDELSITLGPHRLGELEREALDLGVDGLIDQILAAADDHLHRSA